MLHHEQALPEPQHSHQADRPTPERTCSACAQAGPAFSTLARRFSECSQALPLTLSRIGLEFPAGIRPGACPGAAWVPPQPKTRSRPALIRRSAGAAASVSTQVQDCQQLPASLLVEIVPPHHTPDFRLSSTWAALYAPKFYKVQDSQALPPGRPSLGVRLIVANSRG